VSDRVEVAGAPGRRLLGLLLLIFVLAPLYRIVGPSGGSAAAEQTLRLGSAYTLAVWLWCASAGLGAVVLGWALPARPVAAAARRLAHLVLAPSPHRLALLLAAFAATAAAVTSALVLGRLPVLIDGASQLVQARYFASGMLAGPRPSEPEFWQFQFMVLTDQAWVAQYPPGFAVALAVGMRLGAAWLVGPLMLGAAVYLTTRVAIRLLPGEGLIARAGAIFIAASPLLIFHAASYMSHVLALALVAFAIFATLRAADGFGWPLAAGAALGATLVTRPYTAVALGPVALLALWRPPLDIGAAGRSAVARARDMAAMALGGSPFVVTLLAYDVRLFGAATRVGYTAAAGPAHGLGFHVDPWGNPYGPIEAIGYTSADLSALGTDILQSPLPWVALVGVYLLLVPRLLPGLRLAAAWAILPVVANALYWHHDLFMGPRLLYEAVPGWCLLMAAAAAWLLRAFPERSDHRALRDVDPRTGVLAVLAFGLTVGVVFAGPQKVASYRPDPSRPGVAVSAPRVERPALVFVHGTWRDRLEARLSALGIRLDSVRLALRHNTTCTVQMALDSLADDGTASILRHTLAFEEPPDRMLSEVTMPSGSSIRTFGGEALDPRCEREAASDFRGVVDPVGLLWQGDLPGLGDGGAMFVRDFGPERNERLLGRYPDRDPRMLIRRRDGIVLVPYGEGSAELWLNGPAGGE